MSSSYEEFLDAHSGQNRNCRVAYTLNNTQPVLCTYIGDQPFFYMDEEDGLLEDEEGLFDLSDMSYLTGELEVLKHEIESFDSSPLFASGDTLQLFEDFANNAESLTQDYFLIKEEQETRLSNILEILSKSRLVSSYMKIAEKYKIEIVMSEQVEFSFYDRRSGSILINPHMEINDQVLLLSKELRRHWQHRQGVLVNPLLFQPENAILVNRAQEADLAVSVIRTAWELQLAGIKEAWERVENSPMADLARAYAREAFLDFRTINNGSASAAVFEAWFLSERCRQQDKKIVQAMLSDYKGYVFENVNSSKSVTSELISSLGEMPFGKNYLSAHAYIIMDDPIFTEVRDRSNANFLWFIKFERSFKETEQELQLGTDLSTNGISHNLLNNQSQDYNNELQQTADIIQLFEHQSEKRKSRSNSGKPKGKNGAEVIDIKYWSGKQ